MSTSGVHVHTYANMHTAHVQTFILRYNLHKVNMQMLNIKFDK